MWKVSAYIGANLIMMEELWEGLWMTGWYQYAVQSVWLSADSSSRAAGSQRLDVRLHCAGYHLTDDNCMRDGKEQLLP